ncbi:hypothetical protein ADUPG1_007996 [Aduncisulcus paluster]|uniref:Uncharacterized protein n=1 Tax=Aduncisulcus paluster TaxID=2918883 RepID=A0ABQ5KQB7_9EUKA|nr:hypothetical protein ADUPG1_007996 [Aduncisulcus paluster]
MKKKPSAGFLDFADAIIAAEKKFHEEDNLGALKSLQEKYDWIKQPVKIPKRSVSVFRIRTMEKPILKRRSITCRRARPGPPSILSSGKSIYSSPQYRRHRRVKGLSSSHEREKVDSPKSLGKSIALASPTGGFGKPKSSLIVKKTTSSGVIQKSSSSIPKPIITKKTYARLPKGPSKKPFFFFSYPKDPFDAARDKKGRFDWR